LEVWRLILIPGYNSIKRTKKERHRRNTEDKERNLFASKKRVYTHDLCASAKLEAYVFKENIHNPSTWIVCWVWVHQEGISTR
jgi:hypothetical protein